MLDLVDVSKRVRDGIRRREVLHGVNLHVEAARTVGIAGASGSGKTTLLAIAAGISLPTTGEVWLAGEPISRLREAYRASVRRRCIGYVFQDMSLIDDLDGVDNILLPSIPDGIDHRRRAAELLERMDLQSVANTQVALLSGGERQRIALARAMLLQPSVLILDEPTAHLDAVQTERIGEILRDAATAGAAVVIASHDERILSKCATRYELVEGRLSGATPLSGATLAEGVTLRTT